MKRIGLELERISSLLLRWASAGAWFACAALVLVILLGLLDPFSLRQRADWIVSDQFLRVRHAPPVHQDIYLVAIDDGTVEQFGFPLPRSVLAGAIRQLRVLEAHTILIDILLAEPQRKPVLEESEAWLLTYGSVMSNSELSEKLSDLKSRFSEDQVLARAMESAGSVIIPFSFLSAETVSRSPGVTGRSDDTLLAGMTDALHTNPALTPATLAAQLGVDEKLVRPQFGPALDLAMERIARRHIQFDGTLDAEDVIAAALPEELRDTVAALALRRAFDRARAESAIEHMATMAIPVEGPGHSSVATDQLRPPRPVLANRALGLGFADIPLDDDGTLRRMSLVSAWKNRLILHQSLVALLKHKNLQFDALQFHRNRIAIGGSAISLPVDALGRFSIDWPTDRRHSWSEVIPMISLADIYGLDQTESDLKLLRHRRREFFKEMAKLVARDRTWQEQFDRILIAQRQGQVDDTAREESVFDRETIPRIAQLPRVAEVLEQARTSEPPGPDEPSDSGELQYARALVSIDEQIASKQAEYESILTELRPIVRGKLCLIGDTTTGSTDLKRTPPDQAMPGVAVNAAAISSMLFGQGLAVYGYGTSALALIVLGAGFMWPFLRLGALSAGSCGVAGMAAVLFGSYLLLAWTSSFISPVTPLFGVVAMYLTTATYRWLKEHREKKLVRTIFEAQTNPRIVERLIEAGQAGVEEVLAPKTRQVTVFFAEIADYDALINQVSAERLPELLSRTFGTMAKLVLAHEGTLDRYQGHAMVAFFGAPEYQPDHPQRACRAALECCDALRELESAWQERGLPAPHVHVGIHTGELLVGNLTLTSRVDYTVAGENLNVAYRIGELNEVYGTQIMMSEPTLQRCENMVEARELDMVRIKGRREPIRAFELMSAKGRLSRDQLQMRGTFSTGLLAFRNKDFPAALAMFRSCRETAPSDRPATVYIERCERELAVTSETIPPRVES